MFLPFMQTYPQLQPRVSHCLTVYDLNKFPRVDLKCPASGRHRAFPPLWPRTLSEPHTLLQLFTLTSLEPASVCSRWSWTSCPSLVLLYPHLPCSLAQLKREKLGKVSIYSQAQQNVGRGQPPEPLLIPLCAIILCSIYHL